MSRDINTERIMPVRSCAIPECRIPAVMGRLMCLAHWRLVPRPLREEVNRTWRAGPSREYLQARRAAIESVWDPDEEEEEEDVRDLVLGGTDFERS